jgi:hypothetical protein
MALTYGLYPNNMLKGSTAYRALVKQRRKYTLGQVIARVVRRGPSLTDAAVLGILELFMEEVTKILEEGGSVTTPLFKAQCSIAGKFTGPEDYFLQNRHQVKVNLSPGILLKEMASQARPHKTDGHLPRPLVEVFSDMGSGNNNSALTPGGPAFIKGARLQFDADDPEQGIFFEDGARQLFKATQVLRNVYSQLVLMVPSNLPGGTYRLLVNSKLKTKQLRSGELGHRLVVGDGFNASKI